MTTESVPVYGVPIYGVPIPKIWAFVRAACAADVEPEKLLEAAPSLLTALRGLTEMGRTEAGAVIVGPHGWELAQEALTHLLPEAEKEEGVR